MSNTANSPHKQGIGAVQNFAATFAAPMHTGFNLVSTQALIKEELPGKVVYNDQTVFKRLNIDAIPDDFVERCARSIRTKHNEKIKDLIRITREGSGLSDDAYDAETFMEDNGRKTKLTKKREIKMYPHLVCAIPFLSLLYLSMLINSCHCSKLFSTKLRHSRSPLTVYPCAGSPKATRYISQNPIP